MNLDKNRTDSRDPFRYLLTSPRPPTRRYPRCLHPYRSARRDLLQSLEADAKAKWSAARVFEADAPADGAAAAPSGGADANGLEEGKFFGTFPYPYMNGLLHLGHAFSLSKLEFAAAYRRLRGHRVLFPQAWHCTGMPIQAAATRLGREMDTYGVPPDFAPLREAAAKEAARKEAEEAEREAKAALEGKGKAKGKKSKAVAKGGGATVTQWELMGMSGVPEADVPRFRDATAWLGYFPPLGRRDIARLGCGVDWRRSFITTDANPAYDAFVRWQMNRLRRAGLVVQDKRYAVWSPLDGQPCADHDRATGEGVGPQEYTLVKMRCVALEGVAPNAAPSDDHPHPAEARLAHALAASGDSSIDLSKVYLLCATLRPETMPGQTNCWVLPEGEYAAVAGPDGSTFILAARAARNLSHQDGLVIGAGAGIVNWTCGGDGPTPAVLGSSLIGLALDAPGTAGVGWAGEATEGTPNRVVRALPLLTISMNKGTGVVTSVPSDSPDDHRALLDLLEKPALRAKHGVRDAWVQNPSAAADADGTVPMLTPVPIIDVPGLGTLAAPSECERLGITSQNDRVKLDEAKGTCYLRGFDTGVLIAGPFSGRAVKDAKSDARAKLITDSEGVPYAEPEGPVTSRSGDECVVALTDQWYLLYGSTAWRAQAERCLSAMETYHAEVGAAFAHSLGWLKQWACSRSFGLGTRLPFDPDFLVESLSDSTAYMAYYTIAHLVQGDAERTLGREAEGLTYGCPVPPTDRATAGVGPADARPNETSPLGVDPAMLDDAFWDFCFGDDGDGGDDLALVGASTSPAAAIAASADPAATLASLHAVAARCRREFRFWYPMDLRVSGKDLIQNHLSFCLYNHVALWAAPDFAPATANGTAGTVDLPDPAALAGAASSKALAGRPDRWPRAMRCNGHLLLDAEKMSKSKGNFLTLGDAIDEWGADATRLALADAGDGIDDANLERAVANMAVLRLTKELGWLTEIITEPHRTAPGAVDTATGATVPDEPRSAAAAFFDRAFAAAMCACVSAAERAYDACLFREAVKSSVYDLQSARDAYRSALASLSAGGPSPVLPLRPLVERYADLACRLACPIVPHWSEHVWGTVLKRVGLAVRAGWPRGPAAVGAPDPAAVAASSFLEATTSSWRGTIAKLEKPKKGGPQRVTGGVVFAADGYHGWRAAALAGLAAAWPWPSATADDAAALADLCKSVSVQAATHEGLSSMPEKKRVGVAMAFVKHQASLASAACAALGGVNDADARAAGAAQLSAVPVFSEGDLLRETDAYVRATLAAGESAGIASLRVVVVGEGGGVVDGDDALLSLPGAAEAAAAALPGAPTVAWETEDAGK